MKYDLTDQLHPRVLERIERLWGEEAGAVLACLLIFNQPEERERRIQAGLTP